MFVHIGGEMTLPESSIISVINLESVHPSQRTVSDFIKSEDDKGRLQYVTEDIPKTVIVTDSKTYVCSLSSQVLLSRM
ncbi:MAG: DUF370 domain-containing protein [Saccharofermentans sp.]|nr:DUF370 domain-containing protein [Saccharofermentans sp.]